MIHLKKFVIIFRSYVVYARRPISYSPLLTGSLIFIVYIYVARYCCVVHSRCIAYEYVVRIYEKSEEYDSENNNRAFERTGRGRSFYVVINKKNMNW